MNEKEIEKEIERLSNDFDEEDPPVGDIIHRGTFQCLISHIKELEDSNKNLQQRIQELETSWFIDENIQQDGSMRPSISDTVKRADLAEASNVKLKEAIRLLRRGLREEADKVLEE